MEWNVGNGMEFWKINGMVWEWEWNFGNGMVWNRNGISTWNGNVIFKNGILKWDFGHVWNLKFQK